MWNFGFPAVSPLSDVLAAIFLSFVTTVLKNYLFATSKVKLMENKNSYWYQNIVLILKCLGIWFIVSYGFGIILVDYLNTISLGGYKLGFWFAQQGSIYVFVILIFYYAYKIGKIDQKYGVDTKL